MTEKQIQDVLNDLLALKAETEIVEFKEAKNNFDFSTLGKYFSALSNEANLLNQPYAWLIFGVNNKYQIVGTHYRTDRKSLDNLKHEIAEKTSNRLTFIEIHELITPKGRVILFQIPAAPKGIPVSFGGYFLGRDGESAGPLNLEEIERIRNQIIQTDWSKGICFGATIQDLDEYALKVARENFRLKNPRIALEIQTWNDATFLNKAKITINGQITNTAILLLGKNESEHYLSPAIAHITWVLKNLKLEDKDYQHFSCPFLLSLDAVFSRIRNLKYRYMKGGTLFPEEVDRYEDKDIKEALSNCIAHQDYALSGRITVTEIEDEKLIFSNYGSFLPGSIENVLESDQPPGLYRNKFLVEAMVNLNMIDTIGSGIKRMFMNQRAKFFPMPDFDFSGNKVKATLIGKILNMEYTKALARNPDLTLEEILMLDKVQKQKELTDFEIETLRNKNLIEGRKPNFVIAEKIAIATEQVATYLKTRGFDNAYYKKLTLEFIEKNKSGSTKPEIRELLWKKLPDILNNRQKEFKISNVLRDLRKDDKIRNLGNVAKPRWVIKKEL